MNDQVKYLVVFVMAFLFFTFPGILFVRAYAFNKLSKCITAIFTSLGFWICTSWFISMVGLPLYITSYSLLALFIVYFFAQNIRKFKNGSTANPFQLKKIPLHYFILSFALLVLTLPVYFITIPPGCDTAMHGYITRLIINSNSLPHSYRPILPVDYFGSYSAGYHILTALISGVSVDFLRPAINLVSILVYPLTLLALIFSLKNFFSERTAIYTAIIFFGINHTYIGTIWWGGNPSILSFAFCLFSFGLFMHAIQNSSGKEFYPLAFTIAAIPLTHAIPAITFVYVSFLGYIFVLYHYRHSIKWIISRTALLFIGVVILLLPFLLHFKNENSPALLLMIKNWQDQMMGNKLTHNLSRNILVTTHQVIQYRIGYIPTITAIVSCAFLVYFKKYTPVLYIGTFIVFICLLILNSAYWVLPLSELLYPERIVCFLIVCLSFLFGYFLTTLEFKQNIWTFFKGKITPYCLIITVLLYLSFENMANQSIGLCKEKQVNCNRYTRAAFDWINNNTEKDALFVATYADAGMWIPTFTNRATLGTHLHFIHEVQHINDSLNAVKGPRYFFITPRDIKTNDDIMGKIKNKTKVYANQEIEIYK